MGFAGRDSLEGDHRGIRAATGANDDRYTIKNEEESNCTQENLNGQAA
jgi:hypothetical protein